MLEPSAQQQRGDRAGNNRSQQHGPAELPQQKNDDLPAIGTHRLAHADLARASRRGRDGETDQAETGKHHREDRQDSKEARLTRHPLVAILDELIDEASAGPGAGHRALPQRFDRCERLGGVPPRELDVEIFE